MQRKKDALPAARCDFCFVRQHFNYYKWYLWAHVCMHLCVCVSVSVLCVSVCVLSALCGPLWAALQQVCSGTAALSRALDFHRLLHLLSSFIWFYFIFVSILRIASLRQLNAACYEGAGWLMNYLNATCLLLCVEPGNLPLLSSIVRECHQKFARL